MHLASFSSAYFLDVPAKCSPDDSEHNNGCFPKMTVRVAVSSYQSDRGCKNEISSAIEGVVLALVVECIGEVVLISDSDSSWMPPF